MTCLQEKQVINAKPTIYPRPEHDISRADISPEALKVLYRLKEADYDACLVGGAIRDILLGSKPKDFDVVTDATPEEVRKLFKNCRLIGRRFRLAHVFFGSEYIEVATYRKGHDHPEEEGDKVVAREGLIVRDNLFGTLEEDAYRRDFTINGLYYRLADFSLIDYVGAIDDMSDQVIRSIGDPLIRFQEDPVRMLRAVRFAVKLGFAIDPAVENAIAVLHREIHKISPARLFDEVLKLLQTGQGVQSYKMLQHYGLFHTLFPVCAPAHHEQEPVGDALLLQALKNTDARLAQNKSVNPAFLMAAVLWEPFCRERRRFMSQGMKEAEGMEKAASRVLTEAVRVVGIPRRFSVIIQEIWSMQSRFEKRTGKAPHRLQAHPRFRAAYDFFLLRSFSGDAPADLAQWWTRFQEGDVEPLDDIVARPARKRRPRQVSVVP